MYTESISSIITLPSGAEYYRCALQVNCFEYLIRHGKQTPYADAEQYNAALVQELCNQNIQVIGITDHYRWDGSEKLRQAAEAAGITVFPGFEAMSSEGVHFLCLFEPGTSGEYLNRTIGSCGVLDDSEPSPAGRINAVQLLEHCREWKCICIAAHVTQSNGLLQHLQGPGRLGAWKSPCLLAAAIPGGVEGTPQDKRQILLNRDPAYRRPRPVALINAADINDPGDLSKPGAWTWIKMASLGIDGLRQAFLDSESRIRLSSDVPPDKHTEIVAASFEGGFFEGGGIHFNPNLNALVGGRGTGKSTVLEAIRYALGIAPEAPDMLKIHQGIVKDVLKSGTKISLLVRTYEPDACEYLIERTVPNPPRVRNADGDLLDVTPHDVLGDIEIYGQHEISELARDERRRTRILNRFRDGDDAAAEERASLKQKLERSRDGILSIRQDLEATNAKLAVLPGLVETLRRYQQAGLEERLKERSMLVNEEAVQTTFDERLATLRRALAAARKNMLLDTEFLNDDVLAPLTGKDLLQPLAAEIKGLNAATDAALTQAETALEHARQVRETVAAAWKSRSDHVNEEYGRILKELQKDKVDGTEFIRLRERIEQLKPLELRAKTLEKELASLVKDRAVLAVDWEELLRKDRLRYERAARKINRKLPALVKLEVTDQHDRRPLIDLLRDQVGGRLTETVEAITKSESLSLLEFAKTVRSGAAELVKAYGIPQTQAARIVEAGFELPLLIEELEFPISTSISLNTAAEGQQPQWRALEHLSTGQRATAILLVLLLESKSPLLVDQPEDDLDNSFISERIVKTIRGEKQRRQFIFSTHNANIPVIGDAELIVGLNPGSYTDIGSDRLPVELMGSIDSPQVRAFVERILEGGREAFELRRLKYDF